MLGDAYKQQRDKVNALAQYKLADAYSAGSPQIHAQLQQSYKQLGETQLAATEAQWMANYAKQQKQANAGGMGGPGGPISVVPQGH